MLLLYMDFSLTQRKKGKCVKSSSIWYIIHHKEVKYMEDFLTSEERQIEICEVDYMGQYQLCHLLNRFSEIATISAKNIGMWSEEMMKQYGWVVAKQSLHLDQPIYYKDIITLSTTIDNGSFVAFPRYYFIHKGNQQIGTCSSIWTLIDIHKRRIVSPKKIGIDIPKVEHGIHLDEPQTICLDIPLNFITTRQVLYSDVDTNQHMNNTRYIQWALDVIDYTVHKEYFISDLHIQYKKEIRPLKFVQLYLGNQDNRYIVEGRDEDESVYFTIEIYFNKR
jgi:medium-chain acyl-[acyl-carrier-protein] hydrolase